MKKLLSLAAILAVTAVGSVQAGSVVRGEAIVVLGENGQLVSLAFNPKGTKVAATKKARKAGKDAATMFNFGDIFGGVTKVAEKALSNKQFQDVAGTLAEKGFEETAKLMQNKQFVNTLVDAGAGALKAGAPVLGSAMQGHGGLAKQGTKLAMQNAPGAVNAASKLVR